MKKWLKSKESPVQDEEILCNVLEIRNGSRIIFYQLGIDSVHKETLAAFLKEKMKNGKLGKLNIDNKRICDVVIASPNEVINDSDFCPSEPDLSTTARRTTPRLAVSSALEEKPKANTTSSSIKLSTSSLGASVVVITATPVVPPSATSAGNALSLVEVSSPPDSISSVVVLSVGESSLLKSSTVALPVIGLSKVKSSVTRPTVVETTVRKPSLSESSIVESSVEDSSVVPTSSVEISVVQSSLLDTLGVKSSVVESLVVELSAVESSVVDSSVVESILAESSLVESAVVESSVVKSVVVESLVAESSEVELSLVESSVVESSVMKSAVVESSIEESSAVESSIVDSSALESSVVESSVMQSAVVESLVVELSAVESSVVDSSVVESILAESSLVESAVVESSVVKSVVVESLVAESSEVELSLVESSVVESSVMKSAVVESSIEESSAVESSIVDSSALESSVVESSVMQSALLESLVVETSAVESSIVDSSAVESSVVESILAESSLVESAVVESSVVKSVVVESLVAESSEVELSLVESSVVESSVIKSAVVESSVEESSVVESSVVESSAVQSSIVESSAVESSEVESLEAESSVVESSVSTYSLLKSFAEESSVFEWSVMEPSVVETPEVKSSLSESSAVEISAEESIVVESSADESSIVDSSVVESILAESPVVESAVVESSVMKSVVAESAVVESSVVESSVVESSVVESSGVESSGVELSVIESSVMKSGVVESSVEKSSVVESSGVESSVTESSVVESSVVESSVVESPVEESSAVEISAEESLVVESSADESSVVESSSVKSPLVISSVVKSSELDLADVASSLLESSAAETSVVKSRAVESSQVESSVVDLIAVESLVSETSVVASSVEETTVVKSPVAKLSAVDPAVQESSVKEVSLIESSVLESLEVKTSVVNPTVVEPSLQESFVVETPVLESLAVEPSSVKILFVESSDEDLLLAETSVVTTSAVETPVVELSVVEFPVVKSSVVISSLMKSPVVESSVKEFLVGESSVESASYSVYDMAPSSTAEKSENVTLLRDTNRLTSSPVDSTFTSAVEELPKSFKNMVETLSSLTVSAAFSTLLTGTVGSSSYPAVSTSISTEPTFASSVQRTDERSTPGLSASPSAVVESRVVTSRTGIIDRLSFQSVSDSISSTEEFKYKKIVPHSVETSPAKADSASVSGVKVLISTSSEGTDEISVENLSILPDPLFKTTSISTLEDDEYTVTPPLLGTMTRTLSEVSRLLTGTLATSIQDVSFYSKVKKYPVGKSLAERKEISLSTGESARAMTSTETMKISLDQGASNFTSVGEKSIATYITGTVGISSVPFDSVTTLQDEELTVATSLARTDETLLSSGVFTSASTLDISVAEHVDVSPEPGALVSTPVVEDLILATSVIGTAETSVILSSSTAAIKSVTGIIETSSYPAVSDSSSVVKESTFTLLKEPFARSLFQVASTRKVEPPISSTFSNAEKSIIITSITGTTEPISSLSISPSSTLIEGTVGTLLPQPMLLDEKSTPSEVGTVETPSLVVPISAAEELIAVRPMTGVLDTSSSSDVVEDLTVRSLTKTMTRILHQSVSSFTPVISSLMANVETTDAETDEKLSLISTSSSLAEVSSATRPLTGTVDTSFTAVVSTSVIDRLLGPSSIEGQEELTPYSGVSISKVNEQPPSKTTVRTLDSSEKIVSTSVSEAETSAFGTSSSLTKDKVVAAFSPLVEESTSLYKVGLYSTPAVPALSLVASAVQTQLLPAVLSAVTEELIVAARAVEISLPKSITPSISVAAESTVKKPKPLSQAGTVEQLRFPSISSSFTVVEESLVEASAQRTTEGVSSRSISTTVFPFGGTVDVPSSLNIFLRDESIVATSVIGILETSSFPVFLSSTGETSTDKTSKTGKEGTPSHQSISFSNSQFEKLTIVSSSETLSYAGVSMADAGTPETLSPSSVLIMSSADDVSKPLKGMEVSAVPGSHLLFYHVESTLEGSVETPLYTGDKASMLVVLESKLAGIFDTSGISSFKSVSPSVSAEYLKATRLTEKVETGLYSAVPSTVTGYESMIATSMSGIVERSPIVSTATSEDEGSAVYTSIGKTVETHFYSDISISSATFNGTLFGASNSTYKETANETKRSETVYIISSHNISAVNRQSISPLYSAIYISDSAAEESTVAAFQSSGYKSAVETSLGETDETSYGASGFSSVNEESTVALSWTRTNETQAISGHVSLTQDFILAKLLTRTTENVPSPSISVSSTLPTTVAMISPIISLTSSEVKESIFVRSLIREVETSSSSNIADTPLIPESFSTTTFVALETSSPSTFTSFILEGSSSNTRIALSLSKPFAPTFLQISQTLSMIPENLSFDSGDNAVIKPSAISGSQAGGTSFLLPVDTGAEASSISSFPEMWVTARNVSHTPSHYPAYFSSLTSQHFASAEAEDATLGDQLGRSQTMLAGEFEYEFLSDHISPSSSGIQDVASSDYSPFAEASSSKTPMSTRSGYTTSPEMVIVSMSFLSPYVTMYPMSSSFQIIPSRTNTVSSSDLQSSSLSTGTIFVTGFVSENLTPSSVREKMYLSKMATSLSSGLSVSSTVQSLTAVQELFNEAPATLVIQSRAFSSIDTVQPSFVDYLQSFSASLYSLIPQDSSIFMRSELSSGFVKHPSIGHLHGVPTMSTGLSKSEVRSTSTLYTVLEQRSSSFPTKETHLAVMQLEEMNASSMSPSDAVTESQLKSLSQYQISDNEKSDNTRVTDSKSLMYLSESTRSSIDSTVVSGLTIVSPPWTVSSSVDAAVSITVLKDPEFTSATVEIMPSIYVMNEYAGLTKSASASPSLTTNPTVPLPGITEMLSLNTKGLFHFTESSQNTYT